MLGLLWDFYIRKESKRFERPRRDGNVTDFVGSDFRPFPNFLVSLFKGNFLGACRDLAKCLFRIMFDACDPRKGTSL